MDKKRHSVLRATGSKEREKGEKNNSSCGEGNHQRSPRKFSPEPSLDSAPAMSAACRVDCLLVQIEAKLHELVTVVVVVPEEILKPALKEGNRLQSVGVHERRQRIGYVRKFVRFHSNEHGLVR